MRAIRIGFPSGKLKMTLWAGTEDEQAFQILAANSEHPYVRAYGKRYDLTKEEIKAMEQLRRLLEERNK